MILFTAVGWLLQHFDVVPQALMPSLLIGMLAANFVPLRGGCPVTQRPE